MNFTAPIEIIEHGMKRHVVFLPDDVVDSLGIGGITRLIGTVNGTPFRLAALSDGQGRYFLHMGQLLRRDARVKPHQQVTLEVDIDPNPDFVDIPEELEIALDQDPEAQVIFKGYT